MIEALGNIGDFVGGIGVVITLFYLAFQIRASRLQTLAEDTTNAVNEWLSAQTRWLQTEESINLVRRALHNYEGLSADEKGMFSGYMMDLNAAYQTALNLSAKGQLDSRQFQQIEDAMAAYLNCQGAGEWWNEVRPMWPDHVAERMDRIAADYTGKPMTEALAYLARDELD